MRVGAAVRQRIINLCKLNSITVNNLGIICGINQSTLNNIVSGRNKSTTISTIKKICDGLNMPLLEFFNDEIFENLEQEIN